VRDAPLAGEFHSNGLLLVLRRFEARLVRHLDAVAQAEYHESDCR